MSKQPILTLANGHTIPAVGFGYVLINFLLHILQELNNICRTWSPETGEKVSVAELVKYAIQKGYRHIDCAPVYGVCSQKLVHIREKKKREG